MPSRYEKAANSHNGNTWNNTVEKVEETEPMVVKEKAVVEPVPVPVKAVEPITVPVENMFAVEQTANKSLSTVEVESGKEIDIGFEWGGMMPAITKSEWVVPQGLSDDRNTFEGTQTKFHAKAGSTGYFLVTNNVIGSNNYADTRGVNVHVI